MNVKERFFNLKSRWVKAGFDERRKVDEELEEFFRSLKEEDDEALLYAVQEDFRHIRERIRRAEEKYIAESDMVIKNEEEFNKYRDALEVLIAKGTKLGSMELLPKEDMDELCRLSDGIYHYESVYHPLPGKEGTQIKSERFMEPWKALMQTEVLQGEELDRALYAIRDKYTTEEDKAVMEEYMKDSYDFIGEELDSLEKEIDALKEKQDKETQPRG